MADWFKQGQVDFIFFHTSKHLAYIDRDAPSADLMRIFLPPVPQTSLQVATPMPAKYQDWLRGFNHARQLEETKNGNG